MSEQTPLPKGDAQDRKVKFALEYIKDLNGPAALRRAGFNPTTDASASNMASQYLMDTDTQSIIQSEFAKTRSRLRVEIEQVLLEIKRIATVDVAEACMQTGAIKNVHEIPEDVRRAIASIDIEELYRGFGNDNYGRVVKVKFWDKGRALDQLAKYMNLWVERVEVTGKGGAPIELEGRVALGRLDDETLRRLAEGK